MDPECNLTAKQAAPLVGVHYKTLLDWSKIEGCPHDVDARLDGRGVLFNPVRVRSWRALRAAEKRAAVVKRAQARLAASLAAEAERKRKARAKRRGA